MLETGANVQQHVIIYLTIIYVIVSTILGVAAAYRSLVYRRNRALFETRPLAGIIFHV